MNKTMPLVAALACAAADPAGLHAETTIDVSDRHAWGANVGWIDAYADGLHGAVMGQSYCTGFVWSANCGWIGLGGGPANGWRYGNEVAGDWGVNHDGSGRLFGYAYGANIGWVVFEQKYGMPRVDLRTGCLNGYVWGANTGWICLSNEQSVVRTATLSSGPDADNDGLPDAWEFRRSAEGLAVLDGGGHDQDGDGLSDYAEYLADTDPFDSGDALRIVSFIRMPTASILTWQSSPTRLYQIERTGTLAGGGWEDAGSGLLGPSSGNSMSQILPDPAGTTGFYKVRALLPLP